MALLENKDILRFLPHRDPFLFIDELEWLSKDDTSWTELESLPHFGASEIEGMKALAHFKARADHPIFAGHFPGHPVLPGVVQVEMMAQASIFPLLTIYEDPFAHKLDVALMGVSDAKFRKPIYPGMELDIEVRCVRNRGKVMSYEGEISHQGTRMSQASILASVIAEQEVSS